MSARTGATLHEVREFARHADIRTTEVYFVRKEEDAEVAARRIHIRVWTQGRVSRGMVQPESKPALLLFRTLVGFYPR
jgi:hypothetical protein